MEYCNLNDSWVLLDGGLSKSAIQYHTGMNVGLLVNDGSRFCAPVNAVLPALLELADISPITQQDTLVLQVLRLGCELQHKAQSAAESYLLSQAELAQLSSGNFLNCMRELKGTMLEVFTEFTPLCRPVHYWLELDISIQQNQGFSRHKNESAQALHLSELIRAKATFKYGLSEGPETKETPSTLQACSFFSNPFLKFCLTTPAFSSIVLFHVFVHAFDTL